MTTTWDGKNRRNMWRRMKIRYKFPILVAVPTLAVLIAVSTLSFLKARSALSEQRSFSFEQLFEKQSEALSIWLATAHRDVQGLAVGKATQDAIMAFGDGWTALEGDPTQTLQRLYITENIHPAGEKDQLMAANDGSVWSAAHGEYHPGFRSLQVLGGYYDLFLFDLDGNLIYSVFKESDFATNFRNGRYAESGLGMAFKTAVALPAGQTYMTDFAPYAPSFGAPAKFVATPVFDPLGNRIGVVALQLAVDQIGQILSDSPVLGETGQIYAVAEDGTARSMSLKTGGHEIFDQLPNLPQIMSARNEEETKLYGVTGLSGEEVVAYTKVIEIFDEKWRLVLEQDLKEANAQINDLLFLAAIQTGIVFVIIICLGYGIANTLTRRIVRLANSVNGLSDGDLESIVSETKTGDELGDIARALENFKNDLAAGKRAIDAQRQSAETQSQVMEKIGKALAALSEGALDCAIKDRFPEEFEVLRNNFNETLSALSGIVRNLQINAQQINVDAQKLSDGTASLSQRTENQAATLEETVAAMHEIGNSVTKTAAGAREIVNAIDSTRLEAERGEEVGTQAVTAMKTIEESSKQIGNIVQLMDDIAFQTNLLALNAGVEAARAGDAGRGFAVVASEVRALAQRSSDGASEIRRLIVGSNEEIEHGVKLVSDMGSAIEEVLTGVNKVANHIKEIANSAEEQATGLSEINVGIDMLDKVTQQNAAMVDESAASSRKLQAKAGEMQRLAAHFHGSGLQTASEMSEQFALAG